MAHWPPLDNQGTIDLQLTNYGNMQRMVGCKVNSHLPIWQLFVIFVEIQNQVCMQFAYCFQPFSKNMAALDILQ